MMHSSDVFFLVWYLLNEYKLISLTQVNDTLDK